MKILYLYSEIMGYSISTIRELVIAGAEVHVVHWDKDGKLTDYKHPKMDEVSFYPRSIMTVSSILKLSNNLMPDIIVVSGWMDKGYLAVAREMRRKGLIVVACLDGQWQGTLRQWFAKFLGSIGYFSQYFSHAWVAGLYQYEYARNLGFKREKIIYDFYSGDISTFAKSKNQLNLKGGNYYPRRFLYVGRFEEVKGLRLLISAWSDLYPKIKGWELHLVGSGTLEPIFHKIPGVIVKKFMTSEELIIEARDAGCFVLPSIFEPWGVVVHEFAAAGLPLVLSKSVGAANPFLIDGYNGFIFDSNNLSSLKKMLLKIINMQENELQKMGKRSVQLAYRITPETSAFNLLSIGFKH